MSIDPKIAEAIENAVAEAHQDKALSQKIIAWTEAIASGNEDVQDEQASQRHLGLLYEGVQTKTGHSKFNFSPLFVGSEKEMI